MVDSNNKEKVSFAHALMGGVAVAVPVFAVRSLLHARPTSLYEICGSFLLVSGSVSIIIYTVLRFKRKFGIRAARLLAVAVLLSFGVIGGLKLPRLVWSHCNDPAVLSLQHLHTDGAPYQLNLKIDDFEIHEHLICSEFPSGNPIVVQVFAQEKDEARASMYFVFNSSQHLQSSISSHDPIAGCLLPDLTPRWFPDKQVGGKVCETITNNGHYNAFVFVVGTKPYDFINEIVIQRWETWGHPSN